VAADLRHARFMVVMWSVVVMLSAANVGAHLARGETVASVAWLAYGLLVAIPLLVRRIRMLAKVDRSDDASCR
jgi:uncharacterized membrane protein